jgi:hypothetical protein
MPNGLSKPFDLDARDEAYWIMVRRKSQANRPGEMVRCDFCSKSGTEVEKLVAGLGGIHICNECIEICQEIVLDFEEYPETEKSAIAGDVGARCSFCGKGRDDVRHLIAGPAVYICDECAGRF